MMSEMLKPGSSVQTQTTQTPCVVQQYLGGGGQGEVYKVTVDGNAMALKWYYPHYLDQDPQLRERLTSPIAKGAPSNRFLWPEALATSPELRGFGYVMPLREARFKGIVDLMRRRVEPSFRALATAGYQLADSFHQLHAKGLCYQDISFGNVFFDPNSGEVLICDNDNVDINKKQGGAIKGTIRFMAPEIVRGEALPSTQTDHFSLAILLFYMLMIHHPLEGAKEAAIHSFDLPAMTRIYGQEPVFIFDPDNDTNRPVKNYHDNALAFWPIYPMFLRELFTRAFTDGIKDPEHGRVRDSEWRSAMIRLRDSIFLCMSCGVENFYDVATMQGHQTTNAVCWRCQQRLVLPPRIRIEKSVVMLNDDAELFPHHVNPDRRWNFNTAVAAVSRHPNNPTVRGLKNCSNEHWVATLADGTQKEVEPGRNIPIADRTKINFGSSEGEIRR